MNTIHLQTTIMLTFKADNARDFVARYNLGLSDDDEHLSVSVEDVLSLMSDRSEFDQAVADGDVMVGDREVDFESWAYHCISAVAGE